ncbi:MAG: class I SAM-dependent methyltransferase [Burkholderiales bacterium]|nr:class I SAM-dependent methyltransferase [Burkholderiales bacterium]
MTLSPFQWPWPVPAALVWAVCWVVFVSARFVGISVNVALAGATLLGVMGSLWGLTRMRRALMALGFPLSWWFLAGQAGSGVLASLPAWAWLLPLGAALLLYPPATWRDAPLFPTPPHAFDGLAQQVPLPLAGHVLDAGCGLGHGLLALERAYPEVHLHGLENSWPLRLAAAAYARHAHVRQGDMWAHDWSKYDMVYLFQRPESMERAWQKAQTELKPGAWLASLEFAVVSQQPTLTWTCPDGRPLWLYQKSS